MPSPDGRHLAYALSEGGADWADVHVRDLASGRDLPDVVRWFRFSGIAWTKDGKGFFYARFPEPPAGKALEADLKDHQVWYHRVGTPQEDDRLIYWRRELPRYFVGAAVSDDGRYLTISLFNGTDRKNRLLYADLGDPMHPDIGAPIVALVDEDIAELTVLGNNGPVFYVRTDLDAPNRRIVAIDVRPAHRPRRVDVRRTRRSARAGGGDDGGRTALLPVPRRCDSPRCASSPSRACARARSTCPAISSVQGMSGRADIAELFYVVTSHLMSPTVLSLRHRHATLRPLRDRQAGIRRRAPSKRVGCSMRRRTARGSRCSSRRARV